MSEDTITTINMSADELNAVSYSLRQKKVKGRKEIRSHAAIMTQIEDFIDEDRNVFVDGAIELQKQECMFLEEVIREQIEQSIPGVLSKGFVALLANKELNLDGE